ncbi:MAG TPA: hypothetical protein PLO89_01820, partial [Spirochaetota bacterium]|nr:hypothetical protein [Spirochaetota bacterium]
NASDSTSREKIDISWTNIEGVTKWRLQRRDVYIKDDKEYPVVEWRTLKEINSQNYEDSGTPSNVMYSENSIMLNGYKIIYYYKVRGIEGTATDWSNIDSGSILDNSATINPPVKNSNENKLTINWSNGSGLVNNYYQLQKKISGGYGTIYNGETTSYIDSSISPDVNYTYRVTPRIDYVWGVSSNEVEYTLIFEEWIPNISISVITGNSMKISWDGIPTSEKYFLDRTPLNETFEYTHPTARIEDSSTGINFDTIYSYKLRGYKEPNRYTRYSGTVMGKVNP